MKGVDTQWLGKTFTDFTESEQFSFQTTVLRAIVIQQTNPKDNSSIYKIFERLNTGGLRLNAMEVRQCVYESRLLSQLKEINTMADWRDLIGMQKIDKRLKDVELLLRIVSLYRALDAYEKPMKGFINDCALHFKLSEEMGDVTEEDKVLANLRRTIPAVRAQLGSRPFHLRGRLNYSALDATVVAVMQNGAPKNLKERYEKLLSNAEFIHSASYDTSDESVLTKRFKLAFEAFAHK